MALCQNSYDVIRGFQLFKKQSKRSQRSNPNFQVQRIILSYAFFAEGWQKKDLKDHHLWIVIMTPN